MWLHELMQTHVANALCEPKKRCEVAVSCDFLLQWFVSSKLPTLVVARLFLVDAALIRVSENSS
jgi:hypothetical protein